MIAFARSGELEILAARVGRFYREGVGWALTLPLPALLRWNSLIPAITARERA
jgi:hypothetical protein